MNEKLTEEYWLCNLETCQLLKDAESDVATSYYYALNPYTKKVVSVKISDEALIHNGSNLRIGRPYISVAIEWCYELGYSDGCFDYMYFIKYKGKTIMSVDITETEYPEQERQQLFYFIQACCKHRIEQLKQ